MYLSALAENYSNQYNDEENALKTINEAIEIYPESSFPLITKLEICERHNNISEMEETLKRFERQNATANSYTNTFHLFQARLLALKGKINEANAIVDKKLNPYLPSYTIKRIKRRLLDNHFNRNKKN